jgi:dynein light chain LC8-type
MDAPTSSATETTTAPREPNLVGVSQPKAIIKNVDMSEEMQQESVDIASAALEKYNIEKDIAAQIKKEFDRRHGPTWHVVVGKNFGSYVTHGRSLVLSLFFFLSLYRPTKHAFLESQTTIFSFF